MTGNGASTSYVYYRAVGVKERAGGSLVYAYPTSAPTLVPVTITAMSAGNTATAIANISISQDTNMHVLDVWDSDNNQTHYTYGSDIDHTGGSAPELDSVTSLIHSSSLSDTLNPQVQYSYNIATEDDTTPGVTSANATTYYHLNLVNITDQNGNAYNFNYQLHYNNAWTIGFFNYAAAGNSSSGEVIILRRGGR